MALGRINPIPDPPKKGGGLFGSVLGGGLGAIASLAAAPFTGGASLSYLPAAAGMGMTAGGIAGEVIDPSKPGSMAQSVPTIESKKPALQHMLKMPEVQLATMINSKNLLQTSDVPNADQYMSVLDQGIGKIKQRLGSNSSIKFPV